MPKKSDYDAAENFNRDGKNTFKKLQPETQAIVRDLIAKQGSAKSDDEKKPASGIEGNANSIASECIGKDKSPPKRFEQIDLTVKLIVVDEKICFIMNKPVDWLGFDREAAEGTGRQLIALARGTKALKEEVKDKYDTELQKHITLMGKVQYGMEREGWVFVEQFKDAMRFFIDHCEEEDR